MFGEREEKRNTILTIVYFSPCLLLLLHSQDRPASALPHHLLLLHFNEKNLDDEIFFSIKKTLVPYICEKGREMYRI